MNRRTTDGTNLNRRRLNGVLAGVAVLLLAPAVHAQFNESWTVSVGGQQAAVGNDGRFVVENIQVPDDNQDRIGDEFVQLFGTSTVNGVTIYAVSEFFRIEQGETTVIPQFTFTDVAPPKPAQLFINADTRVLTGLGETVQLEVTATLRNGAIQDVTPERLWTTYTTSNRDVLTVSADGLVTARGAGGAFVTARNDAATATRQFFVSPGDALTSVQGFVWNENGQPVAGAVVETAGLGGIDTTTAGDGSFFLNGVPSEAGPIGLIAYTTTGPPLLGVTRGIEPVPNGTTDGGIITIGNVCAALGGGCQDSDGDCLPDDVETQLGLNPNLVDSDGDGELDGAEDNDDDGLTNCAEALLGSDPDEDDVDEDGADDDEEFRNGTDPTLFDTDGDGLSDEEEFDNGTDALVPDSQAPEVTIISPVAGSSVVHGELLQVVVNAEDDGRVARVVFRIDDAEFATDTLAPFRLQYPVNSKQSTVSIEAVAFDTNDNSATSGILDLPVGPDPLTVVAGVVIDETGMGVQGVTVRVPGTAAEGATLSGGGFIIENVPTITNSLVVHAQTADGAFFGLSDRATVARNDVTNAGAIRLRPAIPPRFPGQKLPINDPDDETVVVADINGDAIDDIVVPGADGDSIDFYFGRGDGSFDDLLQLPYTYPYSVDAGDVNGDGVVDLVVSSEDDNNVVALLGNGDGTFTTGQELDDDFAEHIRLADLNLDGALDVLANAGDELEVYLGDGLGGFSDDFEYIVACCNGRVEVADLNGDMVPDVVIGTDGSDAVSVLLGIGDGTLQEETRYSLQDLDLNVRTVAPVDVDSDGDIDLLVAGYGNTSSTALLTNDGTGGFGTPQALPIFVDISDSALGDVNSDGIIDVVGTLPSFNAIGALLLDGQGGAVGGLAAPVGQVRDAVSLGDFDIDGNLDAVTIVQRFNNQFVGSVAVSLGAGDGSFGAEELTNDPIGLDGLTAGDLNGDDFDDLVVTRLGVDNGVEILPGQANGAFGDPQPLFPIRSGRPKLLVHDFNNDMRNDILVAHKPSGNLLSLSLQQEDGSFPIPNDMQVPGDLNETRLRLADMNGDTEEDVVYFAITSSGAQGTLRVYLSDGTGTLTLQSSISFERRPTDIGLADFNNDGSIDVIVSTLGDREDQQMQLLLNNGDGMFTPFGDPFIFPGHDFPTIGAGDMDNDGNADAVVTYFDNGGENWFVVQILFGNGDGTFTPGAEKILVGDDPEFMHVRDINGDTYLDIVLPTPGTTDITILIGNGAGGFQSVERFAASTSLEAFLVHDLDGDAKADLVSAHRSFGEALGSVWLFRQQ